MSAPHDYLQNSSINRPLNYSTYASPGAQPGSSAQVIQVDDVAQGSFSKRGVAVPPRPQEKGNKKAKQNDSSTTPFPGATRDQVPAAAFGVRIDITSFPLLTPAPMEIGELNVAPPIPKTPPSSVDQSRLLSMVPPVPREPKRRFNPCLEEVDRLPFVTREEFLEMLEKEHAIESYFTKSTFNSPKDNQKPEVVLLYLLKLLLFSPEDPNSAKSLLRHDNYIKLVQSLIVQKKCSSKLLTHLFIHVLMACAQQEQLAKSILDTLKGCLDLATNDFGQQVEITEENQRQLLKFSLFCRKFCLEIASTLSYHPLPSEKLEFLLREYIQLRLVLKGTPEWRNLPFIQFIFGSMHSGGDVVFKRETQKAIYTLLASPLEGVDIDVLHELALIAASRGYFTTNKGTVARHSAAFIQGCFRAELNQKKDTYQAYLHRFLRVCNFDEDGSILKDINRKISFNFEGTRYAVAEQAYQTAIDLQLFCAFGIVEHFQSVIKNFNSVTVEHYPLLMGFLVYHLNQMTLSQRKQFLNLYLNILNLQKTAHPTTYYQLAKFLPTILHKVFVRGQTFHPIDEVHLSSAIFTALPLDPNCSPNVFDDIFWDIMLVVSQLFPSIFKDVLVCVLEELTPQVYNVEINVRVIASIKEMAKLPFFQELWPTLQRLIRILSSNQHPAVVKGICDFLSKLSLNPSKLELHRTTQVSLWKSIKTLQFEERVAAIPATYHYVWDALNENERHENAHLLITFSVHMDTPEFWRSLFRVLLSISKAKHDPHFVDVILEQFNIWTLNFSNFAKKLPADPSTTCIYKEFFTLISALLNEYALPDKFPSFIREVISNYQILLPSLDQQEVGFFVVRIAALLAKLPHLYDKHEKELQILRLLSPHVRKFLCEEWQELLQRLHRFVGYRLISATDFDELVTNVLTSNPWTEEQRKLLKLSAMGKTRNEIRVDISSLTD